MSKLQRAPEGAPASSPEIRFLGTSSMPPMPGAPPMGAAFLSSGSSQMMASVVSIIAATEAALRRAELG